MLTLLQSIFAFLITIGILVAIHEWGHFQVARWLNVKILCFSIGFGKPLWKRTFGKDKTVFQIAAIPLGGYVKMLDAREADVPAEELHREFNQQPMWARSLIVAAGPAVNLIFAVLVYILMYMTGITGIKPVVGYVAPDSVAERAGLQVNHEILQVNETLTPHWQAVRQAILQQRLSSDRLTLTLTDETGKTRRVDLPLDSFSVDSLVKQSLFKQLGFDRLKPAAILGDVINDGAAKQAGLQKNDKILQVDDTPINNWYDWVLYVRDHPAQTITVKFERHGVIQQTDVTLQEKEGVGIVGVYLGVEWPPENYFHVERYGLLSATGHALDQTWDVIWLSLRMMGKMLMLEVSSEHISGPVTIADYAGKSFSLGWQSFFTFLGLVSISLGVLNLLPIPMLDGGHLLFYLLETIKGSPLSEMAESLFLRLGVSVLLLLMGLAFFNDFNRLLG